MDIVPIITAIGRRALVEAETENLKFTFTHYMLGTDRYEPSEEQTDLRKKIQMSGTAEDPVYISLLADSKRIGNDVAHLTATIDIPRAIDIGEIGIVGSLDRGEDNVEHVLFAIYSKPNGPLTRKLLDEDLIFAFDLHLRNIPSQQIALTGPGTRLNLNLDDELLAVESQYQTLARRVVELEDSSRGLVVADTKHNESIVGIQTAINSLRQQILGLQLEIRSLKDR